jgi:DNA-binding transcriptional LysR family regulator
LTRAIRQLEEELGGDLFRRERPHAQLTELGHRMMPLLRQCHESALGARALASSIKSGEVGSLRIALSTSVDITLLMPQILELQKHFKHLELKFMRGNAGQVTEFMKSGDAELAIASSLGEAWDRLDRWPLFSESFFLVAARSHRLAGSPSVSFADLIEEPIFMGTECEHFEALAGLLRSHALKIDRAHEISCEPDLAAFVEQGIGIAFVPRSSFGGAELSRVPVSDLDLRRTVFLYGVAGRQRTPVANTLMKMLRANDWSRYAA